MKIFWKRNKILFHLSRMPGPSFYRTLIQENQQVLAEKTQTRECLLKDLREAGMSRKDTSPIVERLQQIDLEINKIKDAIDELTAEYDSGMGALYG